MKLDFKKYLNRKRLLIGGAIIVVIALIIVRNVSSDGERDERRSGPPITVQVEQVRRRQVEQAVTAAGKIRPVFETEISSTISAQIMELRVDEGHEVQAEDVLVILDRARYEAAFERAKSVLRSARAGQKLTRSELDRGQQLFDKKLISLQDLEALEAAFESALGAQEQAEATLEQARDDLDKATLVAPYDGVVTKLNKEVGEMALGSTFQADVLLVISDLSMMEVVVDVDETDVVDIEILDRVEIEVDAIPDTTFSGRVSRVAHSATIIGQGTQEQATNFEVVVTLDVNQEASRIDPRLRPGMSATATIITARHDEVVAVPIQALAAREPVVPDEEGDTPEEGSKRRRGGKRGSGDGNPDNDGDDNGPGPGKPEVVEVVFVIRKDTTGANPGFFSKLFRGKPVETVEQRPVKLGISSDTHYEILSGLEAGEEIVVGNYRAVSKELQDKSRIKRKEKGDRGKRRRRP